MVCGLYCVPSKCCEPTNSEVDIYTVWSISFWLIFLKISELERPIGHTTKYYQPTSVHTPSSAYLRQSTSYNLSCEASFLLYVMDWWKWTENCHKILFRSRSICDRNPNIGEKGLWEWDSEPITRFMCYYRFRDGRDLVENDGAVQNRLELS